MMRTSVPVRSIRSTLANSAAFSSHFFPRSYCTGTTAIERKVAILGAAGGIGQPLSLLTKLNPLVSRLALYDIADVNVPVAGGHAGITILPLFSQASPKANLSDEEIAALTKRTQDGGTQVVEAKAGKGSATLSMAYAGALFADACLKGLNFIPDIVDCSFVQSSVTGLPFFASNGILEYTRSGWIEQNLVDPVTGIRPVK
ncbi:hypothetical protein SAY87_004148 [Trapa incisa]|uniref:Lactate/malate dehydrogenase C-terminal domain-containing protein n=1 Tax=Trapa incisa TaxID=236973 RepID=A0AAN7JNA9_9MYRT|nr:hypothetical protein SAY87_004148 [Trapa incisa]